MTLAGTCGIRLVCMFLELSGLAPFVAHGYGSQHKLSSAMLEHIVGYEADQRPKLGAQMRHKKITACEDEIFPPGSMCLVAIEPVSNFILAEELTEKRDAETWNRVLAEGVKDFDVEVVQSTSDEAKGLLRHAADQDAHHSPDLFHVQHEVNGAMVLPLLRRMERAHEAHRCAAEETSRQVGVYQEYCKGPRRRGRPPNFEGRIQQARAAGGDAHSRLESAVGHQQDRQRILAGIADAWHPYDLETGASRTADEVAALLEQHFTELRRIADEAELSERARGKIEKAARVLPKMIATITFFHQQVREQVEAQALPAQQERVMLDNLTPGLYLQQVANKTQDADERVRLRQVAARLLSPLRGPNGPFAHLDRKTRQHIEQVATDCATLFQRSSSCVEGRNGYLSLRSHALRKLPPKKLRALTVVHNYFIERPDGTTAAERFFETRPADLFEWLVERMPAPARPARRRTRPQKIGVLEAA